MAGTLVAVAALGDEFDDVQANRQPGRHRPDEEAPDRGARAVVDQVIDRPGEEVRRPA